MKISSCLIVKNESENIARCLESQQNIADEIIVVDTGSTDNTKEIASKFGAKILDYAWDNNFSNAKNYALDHATGDWIIFLDADEYLEINTQKVLKQVFKHVDKDKAIDSVLCKMVNIDGYNGRIISVNPIVRILRGKCGIRFSGAVHEQPLKNNNPLMSVNITDYNLIIYHTGYSSALIPEKAKRNIEILEKEIANNQITNLTYYYMSSSYFNLKNYEESVRYALLALKDPDMKLTIMAHQPYIFLIKSMLLQKGKYATQEIEKYVDMALKEFPTHPEVWFVRGNLKREQNDYFAAIESYLKAIEYNKNYNLLLNNDFPLQLESVHIYLAELYIKTGDPIRAMEYYFGALKIDRYNFVSFTGLYKLVKNQAPAEIVFFLNSIYNKENKRDLVFLITSLAKLGNQLLANYYADHYKKYEKV